MEEKYINEVIKQAKKAYKTGEVPVGCIVVQNGKIIAKAHNTVEKSKSAIYHAEINAIIKASKKLKNWRLDGCDMYVTLEPCDMCSCAIELSRINNVYFLLKKSDVLKRKSNQIHLEKYSNLSKKILQDFFVSLRK